MRREVRQLAKLGCGFDSRHPLSAPLAPPRLGPHPESLYLASLLLRTAAVATVSGLAARLSEGSHSLRRVTGAQQGFEPDTVMLRVGEGIGLRERGERDRARGLFAELWQEIGAENGDAFHRCAIAHSMADARDDVTEELAWDLRALEAADSLTDARVAEGGVSAPVAAFYPSLHLNLGDCYRRLGDLDQAREHVQRGRASLGALPDDGYLAMVRDGLDRLARALA